MNCPDIVEQLPLLLYDELDAETAQAVRAHIETCGSCAEQWRELEKTKQWLGEWKPAAAGADVSALLADSPLTMTAPRSSPGRAPGRWAFVGLAASILLMVTLLVVGADVQKSEGRLTVSFGRGAAPAPAQILPARLADFDPQTLEQRIQQATFERIDRRNFELVEEIDRYFRKWDESHARQRTELLQILAKAFTEDVSRLEQGIASVAEQASRENRRTVQRLDELTLAVSDDVWIPASTTTQN